MLFGMLLIGAAVAAALMVARGYVRRKKNPKKTPGKYMEYQVQGRSAADCRGALDAASEQDIFEYKLETTAQGGEYLHITGHRPTGQMLDTLYLLQLRGDFPAKLSLKFVREAFGMKSPIIAEELIDEFMAQKLCAQRIAAQE